MKKQSKNRAIAIFEGKKIRCHWDGEKELAETEREIVKRRWQ